MNINVTYIEEVPTWQSVAVKYKNEWRIPVIVNDDCNHWSTSNESFDDYLNTNYIGSHSEVVCDFCRNLVEK